MDDQVSQHRTPGQSVAQTPEQIKQWAVALMLAVGKRQARTVLDDYRRLAADRRLTKFDRAIAKERAKILAELL